MQGKTLVFRRNPGRRRAAYVVPLVATLMLSLAGPVQATITPSSNALTIAQAIASSSLTVNGASFVAQPPSGTPNGVSTSTLAGFPVDGSDYGVLTSGNVSSVDQPGTLADTDDGGGNVRGDTDLDVSILKIDVTIPAGANCLSFNFRFLSEEYPVFVGTSYNDAFIAELDTSDWTTSGSAITAPHNFAFDTSNDVVSINSTGLGGMSPAAGAGTAFDGTAGPGPDTNGAATTLLGAATPVTAGAHSIYLSLFDQGDNALDSAVFLDNLRTGSVANPATDCKPGAAEAAHLTLTKSVVNTGGGTALATDWTLSATGPTTISGHTGDAVDHERRGRRRHVHARRDGRSDRLQRGHLVVHRRHAHREQPRPGRRRDRELLDHEHVHPTEPGPPDADQVGRQHGRRDGPRDGLDAERDRPDDDLGPHR